MPDIPPSEAARRARLLAELHRDTAKRLAGYRERALKILPHVCARCRREFSGRRLQELTVHHKDHNHDNNPPDGHNWELLCIYCHGDEHEKTLSRGVADDGPGGLAQAGMFSPFEALGALLKPEPAGDESAPPDTNAAPQAESDDAKRKE